MKNNIYYHVVTEKPMYLGQVIIFNENNHSGVYERIQKEKNNIEKVYNNELTEISDDLSKALREDALEEVRKKFFPNYPSRLSCLYVSKTLEEAEFWYNIFIEQKRPTFQIVKVETNEPSFTGDAWNCFKGTSSKETNYSLAKDYWNNTNNKKGEKPIYETLITGRIKVIEIIKENTIDLDKYSK